MNTTLSIKNMVCPRCIEAVQGIFSDEKIDIKQIELGKVELDLPISDEQLKKIDVILLSRGFELLKDKDEKIIEQLKSRIIEIIHYSEDTLEKFSFSKYLSSKLNIEYKQLSTLFSSHEGITLEKFIISQKIEKVKELLSYNELSLSEIAFELGYSSVHYLSNQFKKNTGLTPSQFSNLQTNERNTLDNIV